MSDFEYTAVGVAFGVCAAIMFFGAVPYYALKHIGPGKPPPMPRGLVSTAGFGLVDVIGISLFFGWYALNWVAAGRSGSALSEAEHLSLLLLTQLGFQVFMIVAVVALLAWRMNVVELFGLRRPSLWIVLIAPMTVWLIWSFMAVLDIVGYNEWIASLVGGDGRQEAVKLLESADASPTSLALMALVACIGAPLAEEVVFRGYLYPAMKRLTSIPVAVVFTGLLFGAVHMNLAALLPLTVLGMALALLFEATGSLWAPIAVHFLFNLGTVVAQFVMRAEKLKENAAIIGLG